MRNSIAVLPETYNVWGSFNGFQIAKRCQPFSSKCMIYIQSRPRAGAWSAIQDQSRMVRGMADHAPPEVWIVVSTCTTQNSCRFFLDINFFMRMKSLEWAECCTTGIDRGSWLPPGFSWSFTDAFSRARSSSLNWCSSLPSRIAAFRARWGLVGLV